MIVRLVVVVAAVASLVGCSGPSSGPSSPGNGSAATTGSPGAGVCTAGSTAPGMGVPPSPACSMPPTPPPGAISRDQAIAIVVRTTPGAGPATRVLWTDLAPDPFVQSEGIGSSPAADANRFAWFVTLEGGLIASPCPTDWAGTPAGGPAGPCLGTHLGTDSMTVVLDAMTGDLRGWAP